ncbi:MAG: hypothetical protein EXR72_23285 [Myxococcales bacterium]|nr:hypothetical protein [Myxococcales bacterium]
MVEDPADHADVGERDRAEAASTGAAHQDVSLSVFAVQDPEAFRGIFLSWMELLRLRLRALGKHVAVDGKTSRRRFDAAHGRLAIHTVRLLSKLTPRLPRHSFPRMLQRPSLALLSLLTLALALAAAAGCGPKYPACNNDEDCNKEKPRKEFCVNQQCQQCRTNDDCTAGKRCNKGRCDAIPGYCDVDSTCAGGTSCIDHRCKPCGSDAECGEGGKCKAGACVRKGKCKDDDDCPEGEDCKKGVCVSGVPKKASQDAPCRLEPVYFDYNESALSTEANDSLDKNAACIKRVGRMVQLIGRSDERGTLEYNVVLSERRALSVKDRLGRLGVDSGKLRTLPKGELDATGKDEAGWAQDRRTDFEWM